MKSDFLIALTQLVAERHLPRDQVLQAVEAALVSAFKRDSISVGQNISVKLNPNTGEMIVYALKTVVEEVQDPRREMALGEARKIKKDAELGEEIPTLEPLPHQASRIAAQTAKQVVLQRLREAEREKTFLEFQNRIDDVVSGTVDQIEPGRLVVMDLGRVEAILPPEEQVPTERYRKGQRVKVYVLDVRRSPRGPEIVVSRSHKNLLKRLFEVEVPEVYNGVVEIKAISREPGFRSKVAVASRQEGVDPVGSCIGMRGNRIQSVVNELQGEKIDIVRWDKDIRVFISNALSPSEVSHVEVDPKEQASIVVVPDRQLSLAIGKEGQNARLAAKLVGWRVDIKSTAEWEEIRLRRKAAEEAQRQKTASIIEETMGAEEVAEATVGEPVAEAPEVVKAELLVEPVAAQDLVEEQAVAAEEEPEEDLVGVVDDVEALLAGVAPEEEVLADEIEGEEEEEEEEVEAAEGNLLLDDSIWQSPVATPDAGKIRFAEDFEEFRSRGGRRSARRGSRRGGSVAGAGRAARRGGGQGGSPPEPR